MPVPYLVVVMGRPIGSVQVKLSGDVTRIALQSLNNSARSYRSAILRRTWNFEIKSEDSIVQFFVPTLFSRVSKGYSPVR